MGLGVLAFLLLKKVKKSHRVEGEVPEEEVCPEDTAKGRQSTITRSAGRCTGRGF